ncbi:MAG: thioredoxin family protein [Planctomycetota bacterium]
MKTSAKISCTGLIIILLMGINVMSVIAKEEQPASKESKMISLEDAKKTAKEKGLDILIDFSGSDWCGWCKRLDKEVFSTEAWKKESSGKYILIVLDFPRGEIISKKQKEYNNKIGREFGISGYPTVFVLDSDGRPYAKTGYQEGGPEKYLANLETFTVRKQERDDLLKQTKEAGPEERLPLLENVISQLNKWEVEFGYPEIKEQVVSLDSDNTNGLKLKYATELAQYYNDRENKEKTDFYLNTVKQLDSDKGNKLETDLKLNLIKAKYFQTEDWNGALKALNKLTESKPQGESAQEIYYLIAIVYGPKQLNNKNKTTENLEKALGYAPDSELGVKIKGILDNMKKTK